MPKYCSSDVLDQALTYIQNNAKRIGVVSTSLPSTISSESAVLFAWEVMTTDKYTIENGDVSGRKITIAQMTTLPVRSTGTAGHVILFSTGTTAKILYATSCTTQVLGSTDNSVTLSTWKIEFTDPS